MRWAYAPAAEPYGPGAPGIMLPANGFMFCCEAAGSATRQHRTATTPIHPATAVAERPVGKGPRGVARSNVLVGTGATEAEFFFISYPSDRRVVSKWGAATAAVLAP